MYLLHLNKLSHNPYFSRWFSAIGKMKVLAKNVNSHNPYFSRWFSAIKESILKTLLLIDVTILILVDGFLQYYVNRRNKSDSIGHNPYFSRWFSAINNYKKEVTIWKCHNPYFSRWFSAI